MRINPFEAAVSRSRRLVAALAVFAALPLAVGCGDEAGTVTYGDRDPDSNEVLDIEETPENIEETEEAAVEIETDSAELPKGGCAGDGDCRSGTKCATNADGKPGVCLKEPAAAQAIKLWREVEEWKTTDGKDKWDKEYEGCNIQGGSAACFDATLFEDPETLPANPVLTNVLAYIKVFGLDTPCEGTYVDLFTERAANGQPADVNCSSNAQRADGVADCRGRDGWLAGGPVFKKQHKRDGHPYDRCYVFFSGIPTGRRLVSRASPLTPSAQVKNTYQYNLYIKPEDARTADKGTLKDGFRMEVNVISDSSYRLIPTTAGLSGGIEPDRGALSGTIRDCMGLRVQGGTVAMTGENFQLVYFNANPDNLLPKVTEQFSNKDGSFASVNHEEGIWRLAASVYHDGAVHTFKGRDVRVYADSVTIYGFRGNGVSSYPEAPEDAIRCHPPVADPNTWECEEDLPAEANICQ